MSDSTADENDRLRRAVEEDAHEIGRLRKLLAYLVSDEMRTRIACALAKQPNHVEKEAGAAVELIREVQQDTGYLAPCEPRVDERAEGEPPRMIYRCVACDYEVTIPRQNLDVFCPECDDGAEMRPQNPAATPTKGEPVILASLIAEVLRLAEAAPLPLRPDPIGPDVYCRDALGHVSVRCETPALRDYLIAACNGACALARALVAAQAETAHLQEAIRGAPHFRLCASENFHGADCNCWKASALKGTGP